MSGNNGTESSRILIVEDNPDDLALIGAVLRRASFDVDIATTLADACSMLQAGRYDLLLSDLGLPDSSGLETYVGLAEADPSVPVVILSGDDDLDMAVEAVQLGAQDYLTKTVENYRELLVRVIRFAVERHTLAATVARHELMLRRLIDRSPDGMMVIDENRQCQLMNPAALQLVDDPAALFSSDDMLYAARDRFIRIDAGSVESGSSAIEATASRIEWDGGPAYLVILRDVTDLALAAEAARHDQQTLSHELRTPVASMLGYVEMLQDGDMGPLTISQLAALGVVERNGRRLLELLTEMLILSRVESGQASGQDIEDISVISLLEGIRTMIRPLAEDARLTLAHPDRIPDVFVRGSLDQLERLLLNLLTNAIKFTPGGGTVTLSVEQEEKEVVISVSDTGIGIHPEDLDHVFKRFYRAQTSYDNAIAGTGLGLALSKALVEAHGGSISVTSEVGRGSTFSVRFPTVGQPAQV
ncbi:MAG: ATP-binding protein [Acidimicrobiia bacterium]|nr:ATP-binding protein [Acidimicrobiia bacterium]